MTVAGGNCVFCMIQAGKAPASFVYRDGFVSAFMDTTPINPGHILVVPREHAARLKDLGPEAGERLFRAGQMLAGALPKAGIRCEGVNLFLADGEAGGQDVFHVHLHVIPRFIGDGIKLTYMEHHPVSVSRDELEKVAGALRKQDVWNSPDPVRAHGVTLREGEVVLRPMTEDDWSAMLEWCNDPPDDEGAWSLGDLRGIYRCISYDSYNFIIEVDGKPAGDLYLQRMNIPTIIEKWPGKDLRRIDPCVARWARGKGVGTAAIGLLTRFGFEVEKCDAIFACNVCADNQASLHAFGKNGYEKMWNTEWPPGTTMENQFDLAITLEKWMSAGGRKAWKA